MVEQTMMIAEDPLRKNRMQGTDVPTLITEIFFCFGAEGGNGDLDKNPLG